MTDVDVYSEAERIVALLDDERCDAVLAAIYARADRDRSFAPSRATNIVGATYGKPPLPLRRRPGWLEVVRGVRCCDPAVTRHWRVFRRWLAAACVIVGVMFILETWQRAVLIGVACVVSLGFRWSMGLKRCGH